MEKEKFLNSEDTSPLVVRKIRENGNRKESGTRKESTSSDKKSKFSMFSTPTLSQGTHGNILVSTILEGIL